MTDERVQSLQNQINISYLKFLRTLTTNIEQEITELEVFMGVPREEKKHTDIL